jgi:membrane protein required for colicin V production
MTVSDFHIIEPGILVVLGISGLIGIFRGFTLETLSALGWLGAIVVTIYGFPYLYYHLVPYLENDLITSVVTTLVLFIGSLIILTLIKQGITARIKTSALGGLDRALGFLFGLIRGSILVCLFYIMVLMITGPITGSIAQKSKTLFLVDIGSSYLLELVPKKDTEKLDFLTKMLNHSPKTPESKYDYKAKSGDHNRLIDEKFAELSEPKPFIEYSKRKSYTSNQREKLNRLVGKHDN